MTLINKAMAELEEDFEGWTLRLSRWSQAVPSREFSTGVLSVEPRFVILSDANGFEAFVTAASPFGNGRDIALRYREGLIEADRLRVGGRGLANFRVRVAPKVRDLPVPERIEVQLVAPGYAAAVVTVAVEPFERRGDREPGSGRTSWWRRFRKQA